MPRKTQDIKLRFLSFISNITDSGCMEWSEKNLRRGYGQFQIKGKNYPAHRAGYIIFVGPIEDGLFACHKCDNKRCVNPGHIFIGTQRDNQLDAVSKGRHFNAAKTECKHGHKYTKKNTYYRQYPNGKTQRYCATCAKKRSCAYKKLKRLTPHR